MPPPFPRTPLPVLIVVIVIGAIVVAAVLAFIFRRFFYRLTRRKHTYQPAVGSSGDDDAPSTREVRPAQNIPEQAPGTAAAPAVDRNTSVRSVMTLPAYRPKATENERVLGVGGERDGIDMVVEMQTAEEEEALRDEEMESLYAIRAARRRQIADREERRRLRQQAREARDAVALRDLRESARDLAAQNASEIEELRHSHDRIRETRQRAVSSVSYADVGIARADGTRVRAGSTESTERVGLLSDAASIAASADGLFLRRDRSASATLSIDTSAMAERPDSPGLRAGWDGLYSLAGRSRSRASSAATTPRVPTPSPGSTPHAGSPPVMVDAEDADLGDAGMPPPGYDEVSLDEITPMHSRRNSDVSGRVSPYPDPPPNYPGPGPAERRNSRLSAHMGDLASHAQTRAESDSGSGQNGGIPRLPSLRLSEVPQIVIEPSSERP
ncbi:hypothetical protein N658DRAFT_488337 [Parathielavia hyrcaniae]|uniref:Uncharacterized protein n=1 Tax=Parathielavia hyrcaniae TaxID=113614 RepID=A0AAN6Q0A1_9PEZI|nr:hypothetical protein N658DRAFT_488337 [Parathielavia hyrcaniae]